MTTGSTPVTDYDTDSGEYSAELVARIGAGDRAAEQELVARFRRGLFFVLRKECSDPELAQDLTQDTFEKVIRNARAGKIQKPHALAWYIRRMGVYQLIDLRRKEKRRQTTPSPDIAQYVIDDSEGPAESVSADQSGVFVRQLLDEMTVERDRELLRRFYLVGQDKKVIAKEFDITLAHFDRVKSRALLRLRKLVNDHLKQQGTVRKDFLALFIVGALLSVSIAHFVKPPVRDNALSAHVMQRVSGESLEGMNQRREGRV